MKFEHYIRAPKEIEEAAYMGNLGFVELVKFYQKAQPSEIDDMENIIKKNDWEGFKNLIYKILKVKLK